MCIHTQTVEGKEEVQINVEVTESPDGTKVAIIMDKATAKHLSEYLWWARGWDSGNPQDMAASAAAQGLDDHL